MYKYSKYKKKQKGKHKRFIQIFSLGQLAIKVQDSLSELDPWQSRPLYCAAGLLQDLERDLVPASHVVEHAFH